MKFIFRLTSQHTAEFDQSLVRTSESGEVSRFKIWGSLLISKRSTQVVMIALLFYSSSFEICFNEVNKVNDLHEIRYSKMFHRNKF